jgi:hypothetical protein
MLSRNSSAASRRGEKKSHQAILGVFLAHYAHVGSLAALPIEVGCHYRAVEALDRPAILDKVRSQPVQQALVRGLRPERSQIVRRGNETAPKVVRPDAVDDGSGSQRVARIDDPMGERRAPPRQSVRKGIRVPPV